MEILLNTRYVRLNKDNLRGFVLKTNSVNVLIQYNNKYQINTLIIEDSFRLKLKDVVNVEGIEYQVNIIQKVDKLTYYCIQEPITKTAHLIVPFLGGLHNKYSYTNALFNAYLSEDFRSVYLVYKFIESEEYLRLEERLCNHEDFIGCIDPSPDIVVFQIGLKSKYLRDVEMIMQGNYSRISQGSKVQIYTFHRVSTTSRTYRALFKHEKLKEHLEKELNCTIPKDLELMSKPIIEREIWTFQNISNMNGTTS